MAASEQVALREVQPPTQRGCLGLSYFAYQQLSMRPETQFVRPLVTWSPEHERPVFFVASALMFGTVGSVYAFNRASLSLWHLMVYLGRTWCTCYFDDFPRIEATKSAKSSRAFMEGLLKALGWKFAEQGKKAKPHAPVFDALGVTLDLTACRKGSIKVYNKKSRVADLKLEVVTPVLVGRAFEFFSRAQQHLGGARRRRAFHNEDSHGDQGIHILKSHLVERGKGRIDSRLKSIVDESDLLPLLKREALRADPVSFLQKVAHGSFV